MASERQRGVGQGTSWGKGAAQGWLPRLGGDEEGGRKQREREGSTQGEAGEAV